MDPRCPLELTTNCLDFSDDKVQKYNERTKSGHYNYYEEMHKNTHNNYMIIRILLIDAYVQVCIATIITLCATIYS